MMRQLLQIALASFVLGGVFSTPANAQSEGGASLAEAIGSLFGDSNVRPNQVAIEAEIEAMPLAAGEEYAAAVTVIETAIAKIERGSKPGRRALATLEGLRDDYRALDKLPRRGQQIEISVATFGGKMFELASLRGKMVLVQFLAAEDPEFDFHIAELNRIIAERSEQGLAVVVVARGAVDEYPPIEVTASTIRIGDRQGEATKLANKLGVTRDAAVLLLDQQGKLLQADPDRAVVETQLSLTLGSPMPLPGAATDDALLTARFVGLASRLRESGKYPTAEQLVEQVATAPRVAEVLPAVLERRAPLPTLELASRARAATVMLGELYLCDECPDHHANIAGGVLVSPSGLVLTNHHVIATCGEGLSVAAMLSDNRCLPVVKVLAADEASDVALLQLGGATDLPFAPLAAVPPAVLDDVLVVSHPQEHFFAFTAGHVSRYAAGRSDEPGTEWLEITADYAEGSSGSGVFNRRGEVVGLVCATESMYTSERKRSKADLQMVVKHCVPWSALRACFAESTAPSQTVAPASSRR